MLTKILSGRLCKGVDEYIALKKVETSVDAVSVSPVVDGDDVGAGVVVVVAPEAASAAVVSAPAVEMASFSVSRSEAGLTNWLREAEAEDESCLRSGS